LASSLKAVSWVYPIELQMEEDSTDKKRKFEHLEMGEQRSDPPRMQPTITSDDLYELIAEFAKTPFGEWTETQEKAAIAVMRFRTSITMTGESDAQEACFYFLDQWEKYLYLKPEVRKQVDPWLICLSFSNPRDKPSTSAWERAISDLGRTGGITLPTEIDHSGGLYAFPGSEQAMTFGGYMKGRYLSIEFSIFECMNPIIHYC
jgi:hypothetical protein